MASFLTSKPLHLQKSHEYAKPPPKGQAHAVAVPNSKKPERSHVYRHWRFVDGLFDTLDPAVRTVHDSKCFPEEKVKTATLTAPQCSSNRQNDYLTSHVSATDRGILQRRRGVDTNGSIMKLYNNGELP